MDGTGDIVIGAFYERPDGSVARTCGWDGKARLVSYRLDDGAAAATVAEDAVRSSWTRRPDLADFPDARDPRLPFVFDLMWDAKHRSELPGLLACEERSADVREAMANHSIELTPAEEASLSSILADRDLDRAMGFGP